MLVLQQPPCHDTARLKHAISKAFSQRHWHRRFGCDRRGYPLVVYIDERLFDEEEIPRGKRSL